MRKAAFVFLAFFLLCANIAHAQQQTVTPLPAGKKLIVGLADDPPYTMKDDGGRWTGLNVDLWTSVAKDLKLDYEFKEMPLAGIIAALNKGTIDLTIVGLFVIAEREKLLDFSVPIGSSRMAVITLPHAIDHPWWSAMRVLFSWGILKIVMLLAIALLFVGLLFWIVERKHNPEHFGGGFFKGLCAGIYWVGATMASGVCFGVNIKSFSGRILALMWMFICTVILSAFIASLASSLTLEELTASMVDMHSLRKMKIGALRGGTSALVLQRIGGKFILFDNERNAADALINKKIQGFLYDEITLHYISERDYPGQFSIYPTNLKRFHFAFGFPVNSPFRKPINAAMLTILHDPLWELLLDKYGFKENFEKKPLASKKKRS
jgi:polar amino acid transport system substrate-binding protein